MESKHFITALNFICSETTTASMAISWGDERDVENVGTRVEWSIQYMEFHFYCADAGGGEKSWARVQDQVTWDKRICHIFLYISVINILWLWSIFWLFDGFKLNFLTVDWHFLSWMDDFVSSLIFNSSWTGDLNVECLRRAIISNYFTKSPEIVSHFV